MTSGHEDVVRRRRWPYVVVALVVAVGVAAGVAWSVWLPEWRPALRAGERYGVDVSAHQGTIDWRRVHDDGIGFAYIKATEGGDFVDRRFAENWRGAATAGLDTGAYHFFTLCTPGAEQARNFLATAPPDPDALPPAVDLELAGNCRGRPDPSQVTAELTAFVHLVEDAWERPVIYYLRDKFEARYPLPPPLERSRWDFRFLRRPAGSGWTIWQVQGRAHVEGIPGRADLDVRRSAGSGG